MLSLKEQKLLRKLRTRKGRKQEGYFIAEGFTLISDLRAGGLHPLFTLSTAAAISEEERAVSATFLKNWSAQVQPEGALAVFPIPEVSWEVGNRVLVFDAIQDPGNLGTLLRSADWFGYPLVLALPGSADAFNPKAVQSSMGSVARVSVRYCTQEEAVEILGSHHWLTADMSGRTPEQLLPEERQKHALILGNESHGPSALWREKAQAVHLPRQGHSPVESLNVATAGSILMYALRA